MKSSATQPANGMTFRTKILTAGKTATGIQIPDEVIAKLDAGKKPPICVTINRYTYRSTVAVMGGRFMVGVNAENREKANVAGGDTVDVTIALDTAPREIEIPADFAAALKKNTGARKTFDSLSYSKRKAFVQGIEGSKTAETRERRIQKVVAGLQRAGR